MSAVGRPLEREQARTRPFPLLLSGLILAALALGIETRGDALVPWYVAFVVKMGLGPGSLGLLMIGHIFGEASLSPLREEFEAAGGTPTAPSPSICLKAR